jgi:cytochrome c
MNRSESVSTLLSFIALVLGCSAGDAPPPASCPSDPSPAAYRVLVFTRTTGFRHASIPAAIAAVQALGAANDFAVDATENPAAFTDSCLARYAAVLFLNTTGDVLENSQQVAFERYIGAGHGFVGVHSASDTEYDWPWYHELLGAFFAHHPAIQQATVLVTDTAHASTRSLPNPWVRTDEWYNYRANPPGTVTVLARLDETTYTGGRMGPLHPISWQQTFGGGRGWYTAMGHTDGSYSEPEFLTHLLGGIRFATGLEP